LILRTFSSNRCLTHPMMVVPRTMDPLTGLQSVINCLKMKNVQRQEDHIVIVVANVLLHDLIVNINS